MKNSSSDAELPIFWKAKTSAPTRLEPNRCGMKRNWCSSQSLSESRNVNASVRERQETRNHVWIWHIYIWYYPRKIIKHHWNIPELFSGKRWGWILEMLFVGKLCWWPAAYTLDLAVHSVHSALQPWPEALVAPVGLWVENTDQWFVVSMFSTIFL